MDCLGWRIGWKGTSEMEHVGTRRGAKLGSCGSIGARNQTMDLDVDRGILCRCRCGAVWSCLGGNPGDLDLCNGKGG